MKHTKSVIAILITAVICLTSVCPAMAAELSEEATTMDETAIEREIDDSVAEEDNKVSDTEFTQSEDEVSIEDSENERVEYSDNSEIEEYEDVEKQDDSVEEIDLDQLQTIQKDASDNTDADEVAQAIYTGSNRTLTFFYGPQVLEDDIFEGAVVTKVWAGSSVTDTGNNTPGWSWCASATTVKFDTSFLVVKPTSLAKWFYQFYDLTSVDLSGLNTSEVTNMCQMFFYCESLTNLDLSSFDTSNVTNMSEMFMHCFKLENLDLRGIDTSKVTDMSSMFYGCKELMALDVSSFNTSHVADMSKMFFQCGNISSLNLDGFDTSNVTDMSDMFFGCGVSSLDLSSFNTSNVTNMREMFRSCFSIESLDLSSFDTSNVTDMSFMFYCPVSGTTVYSSLKHLNLSGFDTSKVTNMESMFAGCKLLESVSLNDFDTSNVNNMSEMFAFCQKITGLDLSGFNTSNVTNMNSMFSNCDSLVELNLTGFDTTNVTDMHMMFWNCRSLESLDLSSFNTSNVTNMQRMFDNCNLLEVLDLSGFDTSGVTDFSSMFFSCSRLMTIYCEDNTTDWSSIQNGNMVFAYCNNLTGRDGNLEIPFSSGQTDKSMAKAAGLGGYFTPKNPSSSNPNGTIIERVREYTSDDVLAQLNQITNSNDPSEVKFHRMNALFANYGFTDAKEGVHYLSNTHDKRYAYLMLTTDEAYCANNYVEWLKSGTLAAARRALLFADGLIFNNEINDWLSFTTYSETEFPGVKKYKTMLYDFMDASSKSIEIQSGIKFASDLASKSTGTARIEAENIVNQLNNCSTVAEERAILTQASNEGIYVELAEARDENGNILLNYKLDESSGFGEFQKLMGYGTKTLSIANMTISDIMDIIELDSKLATYTQYKHFLQEVVADTSVPFQLRWAASLIISELDAGYLGEIKDVAMDIIGQTELNSTVKKAILTKIGAQSLSSWLVGHFSLVIRGKYEIVYLVVPLVILAYLFANHFNIVGMGRDFSQNLGVPYNVVLFFGLSIAAAITASVAR